MIFPPAGFQASPNTGSQLERAIAAWLVICGAGNVTQQYVSNDPKARTANTNPPLNDILAHKSSESPRNSRDEAFQVKISSEFPSVVQPGNPDANWSWKQINLWIGTIMAAMSITDNGGQDYRATCKAITDAGRNLAVDASNGTDPGAVQFALDNADMSDFTCTWLLYQGCVRAKQNTEGLLFVEERNFEIDACSYAIPDFLP